MNGIREELVNDVMSMNAAQFAKLEVAVNFVFSLPKHQQAEAVTLYTSGVSIPEIAKRMAVQHEPA